MPLAFASESHGEIAFGFFNIESDMLLLDRYFFFCTEFCDLVRRLAEEGASAVEFDVYAIPNPAEIGDLMGAIHGIRFIGFLGDVYRRFPFPADPEAFRQHPEGCRTRREMEGMIAPYASSSPISVAVEAAGRALEFGVYRFSRPVVHQLLDYVWRGGYPRWRNAVRPPEVMAMREHVQNSTAPLFAGAAFSP